MIDSCGTVHCFEKKRRAYDLPRSCSAVIKVSIINISVLWETLAKTLNTMENYLNMLGLYLYTLIISHKSGKMLSILNKFK